MKRKQKKLLLRIIISVLIFSAVEVLSHILLLPLYVLIPLFAVPYLIAGYDVILKAGRNIISGRVFDENFLMCVATFGAFAIGEYPEAVFVMIFYQTGELFQSIAVGKSRRSISALMDIKPETATVIRDGKETVTDPEEVKPGEIIIVRPGEKIPLDGIITEGKTDIDAKALTGESEPRFAEAGMKAVSGCINLSGTIKIEVGAPYGDSTVAKILELVENASAVKARTDRFITRFAAVYTPAVVVSALLLFLVPSLITKEFSLWLGRALIFLVISCPCALVISVPLSYFTGIGTASKKGILVKGAVYLEALAEIRTAVFDKTGTLTKGNFKVCAEKCFSDKQRFYEAALACEMNSNHPVAKAVSAYCREKGAREIGLVGSREIAGKGIKADTGNSVVCAGNVKLMQSEGIAAETVSETGSTVFVSENGALLGYFIIKDEIKENAAETVKRLKKLGVKETVMLTGDREETAREIAEKIGLDGYFAGLLPADKLKKLEEIQRKEAGGRVLYAGDGINDAPVLTAADVGIAMGAMGSDAAIEAADVVLMDDDPEKIVEALMLAKRTKKIVYENIVFALGIKLLFMVLGAFGLANLWMAVFADVGVSVIAILNSFRVGAGNNGSEVR